MIELHYKKNISSIIHRSIALVLLILAFAIGVKAQKYYVIYYTSSNGTRYYLSISESSTGLDQRTSTLTNRCYWKAEQDLKLAVGNDGPQELGGNENTQNEFNKITLRSVEFPNKYLIYHGNGTEDTAKEGTPNPLRVSTSVFPCWLIDENNHPILYHYYHKHYLYVDESNKRWRYSSKGKDKPNLATIELCASMFPPIINMTQNVNGYSVSITTETDCNIYYTIDGTEPTSNSNEYTEPLNISPQESVIIKAIAVKNDNSAFVSDMAEIILSNSLTVTLDDREDHNWTYYNGVNTSVDGGNYNTNYKGKIYSPNPRNVKVTYNANGGAVSITEPETSFVYYKTLEQGDTEGEYPYTVISNPFSKRPTGKGFGGWKIISGHEYIKRADGNPAAKDATLRLDEEITFTGLDENYTKNCTSAEIVFQATWVNCSKTYAASNNITYEAEGGTYETNFLVLNNNISDTITLNSPCTIMMVEPDGSKDYRQSYKFTGTIDPVKGANKRTKIEYAHWNPSDTIDAKGQNFTIGRGMKMDGTARHLYGLNTEGIDVNQILKIESGRFNRFTHYQTDPNSIIRQWVTLGCDYDRAKENNNNLEFRGRLLVGDDKKLKLESTGEMCRVYGLSGRFMTNVNLGTAALDQSYYMSVTGTDNKGFRYLEIQGGEWLNISGGRGQSHEKEVPAFTFRMKGGLIKGSIYGAAEYATANGTRTYIITGGTINGWVAGGANGTRLTGGNLRGSSYVYVGGNARVDSDGSTTIINRALGGNVFGAGCGYCSATSSTSGEVTLGTNVVIADNAYVERGVYGGGSYGYCKIDQTSNIYITGGTIDGVVGGVNANPTGGTVNNHAEYSAEYNPYILGGVYGGACQNKGGSVNIYMTGGMVNGGLYGGSNASGTLSGNVNVKITGGTIGGIVNGNQANANVYGGGYGSGTAVNGAVSMTLGNSGASTGATVNGDVYGGGAEGKVNNSISINVNAANINGDLYGGGHGASAEVSGNSAITMTGGTIGNVFGGGNAAKLIGNSSVTITDGTVTSNVYGGGNQAEVKGTTNVVIGN